MFGAYEERRGKGEGVGGEEGRSTMGESSLNIYYQNLISLLCSFFGGDLSQPTYDPPSLPKVD